MSRALKASVFSLGLILALGRYSGEYVVSAELLVGDSLAFHKFIAWVLITGLVASLPNLLDQEDGGGLGHSLASWCLVVMLSFLSYKFLGVPRYLALSVGLAYGTHLMLDYMAGAGVRLLGHKLGARRYVNEEVYGASASAGVLLIALVLLA